jgi:hypothetical protein
LIAQAHVHAYWSPVAQNPVEEGQWWWVSPRKARVDGTIDQLFAIFSIEKDTSVSRCASNEVRIEVEPISVGERDSHIPNIPTHLRARSCEGEVSYVEDAACARHAATSSNLIAMIGRGLHSSIISWMPLRCRARFSAIPVAS